MLWCPAVFGQDEGDDEEFVEDEYSGEGFSLHGASGFFNVLSPVLIRPGNILAGFSYWSDFGKNGSSAPPVTIGYGLAQLSELYLAFEPRSYGKGHEENETLFGVKMLGMVAGDLVLGAGIAYRSLDVTIQGEYDGRLAYYGGALYLGYDFAQGFRLLGNMGYAVLERHTDYSSDYLSFGAGLSHPLNPTTLVIAEFAGRSYSNAELEFTGTLGGRYYFFNHIQANAGLQLSQRGGEMHVGAVVGIGFSSEILRTRIEGEGSEEILPDLPSLEALESGLNEGENGEDEVPTLPGLDELETSEEKSDADDDELTAPELPSLEELDDENTGVDDNQGEEKQQPTEPPKAF